MDFFEEQHNKELPLVPSGGIVFGMPNLIQ